MQWNRILYDILLCGIMESHPDFFTNFVKFVNLQYQFIMHSTGAAFELSVHNEWTLKILCILCYSFLI